MIYERSIKFTIESKIDDIALLSKAFNAVCNTVVSDEVLLYNISLCLVEAVTNVIEHAYQRQPNHPVEVFVKVHDDYVILQIIDAGNKANLTVPKKELEYNPKDLTTWPESGMGLFLIYRIMDEVSFSELEGKNILTMKKNLNL